MSVFEKSPTCPMCGIIAIKLVPLYDNDNKHEKQMCCHLCKKKIKKGIKIEKIIRREN